MYRHRDGSDGQTTPVSPIASRSQPTVPSPPATIILQLMSWNCLSPGIGPPSCIKLNTWRGLSRYWNFLSNREPCLPPLFGFINTTRGITPGGGIICSELLVADTDIVEFWRDNRPCRSKTLGLIDVGGNRCSFRPPRSHSSGNNGQQLVWT